jgi:hypothetical protein
MVNARTADRHSFRIDNHARDMRSLPKQKILEWLGLHARHHEDNGEDDLPHTAHTNSPNNYPQSTVYIG